MNTIDLRYTVAELMDELSKLPADAVLAIPMRWTIDIVNEVYADTLKAPLTPEQWAEVASTYLNELSEFIYEESDQTMNEAIADYLKEEEE